MITSARQQASPLTYRSLIWNFAQRDLKSRYKGTALGWFWSLLLPLATLGIFSLVFSTLMKFTPPPFGNGDTGNFTVFLFCGLVVWGAFSNSINITMLTLIGTGPLLKKIYFPVYAPILGSIIAALFQSVIELGILLLVLVAIGNLGATWLLVPFWALLFVLFVTGITLGLSILNVFYRDLAHLVSVGLQLLFYLTPIIYPPSTLAGKKFHGIDVSTILNLNPVAAFVNLFRDLVYGLTPGSAATWGYALLWACLAMAFGAWAASARGQDLSEEL